MTPQPNAPDADTGSIPDAVGVLGGGRMGGGIAHAFLLAGAHVTVVEQHETAAAAAQDRIIASLTASIARGHDADIHVVAQRLSIATSVSAFAGCELVVEAVPEVLGMKTTALSQIEARVDASAVLASNTSSIPLSTLATALRRPDQFIGLHFFNPVPASTLIEIVLHPGTSSQLAERARAWVRALGKTPITVADAPGFASSRLGVAIALEAMRMVEAGVASAADIDLAMELGYKHPTGPLKTTDIVGLDVRLGIAEQLERDLGPRFAPPQLLRDMVAEGKLGRKTGQGFYDWS